jgi:cytochrome c oxidase subunit 2
MTNSFDYTFKHKWLNLPEVASVHGRDVDDLIVYLHWLMIALFVGWTAYFFYTVWRFRQSRNPKADYHGVTSHASSYVEIAVAVVEGVLLIFFAIPLWAKAVDKFPSEKESIVIRVAGQQFNWMARYPGADGIFGKQDIKLITKDNPLGIVAKDEKLKASDPAGNDDLLVGGSEVAVPVNTNVVVHVTSLDVIHSFKVPALRITQDAIPGMRIPLHFNCTVTNTYQINCAQLCGNGHSNMKGTFRILDQPGYEAWLKSKSGGAAATTFE